jgi:peptidoglycan/LPS O-acetylase OafA/YrhL
MNKLTSLYLDFIRAFASICVVFYHYNNHIENAGRRVFPNVGQEAVMIFFVLSGFVITWVIETKEKKAFRTYALTKTINYAYGFSDVRSWLFNH